MVSGNRRKFTQRGLSRARCPQVVSALLRNVNLFLFVNVAEKVYQATNKGYCRQPECDPSRGVTSRRRLGHKLVKVVDRSDGGCDANHYRENIFQAFHFEPPARKI